MNSKTIEVEAVSMADARRELHQQVPPGLVILQEQVLSDGTSQVVEAMGATVDEALENAKANLPAAAIMEKHDIREKPARETLRVEAYDEQSARHQARISYPKRIESLVVERPGRKGFLGIGRRPHLFSLVVIQPAIVKLYYRQKAKIRATIGTLVEKYKDTISEMSDEARAAVLRGENQEHRVALLEVLKNYSGKVEAQTQLAEIDLLASGDLQSKELAMQVLLATGSMATVAWKIAYELRARSLQRDELVMPLSQIINLFSKTPPLGYKKAQSALEYVRHYLREHPTLEQFEERFAYFSRSEPLVSEADFQTRKQNKLLCQLCGQRMKVTTEGVHVYGGGLSPIVKLRCEKCDITRFEKREDIHGSTSSVGIGENKCFKCGKKLKGLDTTGKISMIDESMFKVMKLVCEKCGLSFCTQCAGRKGFNASCPKCGGETTPPLVVPPGV